MKTLLFFLCITGRAYAANVPNIPQIGPHTPILKVEKSENPQNLMIVYTKLEPSTCGFAGAGVLDEYWLMDGSKYKPVNPMIKNAVSDRFELDREAFKSGKFVVHLKDFHELKSDLGSSPTFEVISKKGKAGCDTDVVMTLGPSDKNRKISVDSIYADSSKTVLPPFRKLNALTLKGRDFATGEAVQRTYKAD